MDVLIIAILCIIFAFVLGMFTGWYLKERRDEKHEVKLVGEIPPEVVETFRKVWRDRYTGPGKE